MMNAADKQARADQRRAQQVEWEEYLRSLQKYMQEAVKKTQRYDAKWNKLNDEIDDYLNRSGITDLQQRSEIKMASLPLQDAFGAGKWWREKSQYLASVISAECALRGWGL